MRNMNFYIFVVIPVYNEAAVIADVVEELKRLDAYEIIVVDDGSSDNTYEVMLTNIKEVKAREAPVIALAAENDGIIGELVDLVVRVPSVSNLFTTFVNTVALQLLAYHTARYKGCPIDFPRNLAKSVTVE